MSNSKEIKWEKILKNSIQCKYCGEIIESKTVVYSGSVIPSAR
jgi:hypothetical protein